MKVGIDIEEVKRFKDSYQDQHFIGSIFTEKEIKYCQRKKEPYISFTGKFCAKEAVIKASSKNLGMKDIEILNHPLGEVRVFIKGEEDQTIKCSISHTDDYAVAFVVIDEVLESD